MRNESEVLMGCLLACAAACGPAVAPAGSAGRPALETCPADRSGEDLSAVAAEPPTAADAARDPRGTPSHPAERSADRPTRPDAGQQRALPLSAEDAELRGRGLAAMDEGRYLEARQALEQVLERYPGNLATEALYLSATAALRESQEEAGYRLANVPARRLERPPFEQTSPAAGRAKVKPPILHKLSETRNQITDDERWFRENGLSLPVLQVPSPEQGVAGDLPPGMPLNYGSFRLVQAIVRPENTLLFFGANFGDARFLAVFDAERSLIALFDFESYLAPPDFVEQDRSYVDEAPRWAEIRQGVLYVSNFHRTYAASSKGKNAYLTALDLETGELLWRSAPLTANSANFLIHGEVIVSGYGFTAEPDYLYLLDRATGETLKRIKLRSGANYIIEKDDRLFVRAYDTDYVFEWR